jgi:16S rRNA (uracil1498-N3)-methyltransferase
MNLPCFFKENLDDQNKLLVFDEETSRHIVQVLRMTRGEMLQITNGRGRLVTAEIVKDHKRNCEVKITDSQFKNAPCRKISIAISLLKNTSRFEWFLEKTTEIGIREIIPLICERTEKQHFRYDRMKNICISAMLQSQQVWMPELQEPVTFKSLFENLNYEQKFIAHCTEKEKRNLSDLMTNESNSAIVLIGPEGDFTNEEIELAISNQFLPVSLGETRLRTETAGVVAAVILSISQPVI